MFCVKKIINDSWKKLNKISESPILDTEVLLAYLLEKPREFLYSHPEYKITPQQYNQFKKLLLRRCQGEPIAYLLNNKEFYGLNFYVDKRVLIPRPDTEKIIDQALSLVKKKRFIIVDVGTGSGCLAIVLKKYLPQCEIIATDISKPALKVAKKNARQHKVKITFYQGSLLKALPKKYHHKIDLIVANLPYLPANIARKKSLKYEPPIALRDHKQIKKLLKQAPQYLKPKGKIIYEGLNGCIYQK